MSILDIIKTQEENINIIYKPSTARFPQGTQSGGGELVFLGDCEIPAGNSKHQPPLHSRREEVGHQPPSPGHPINTSTVSGAAGLPRRKKSYTPFTELEFFPPAETETTPYRDVAHKAKKKEITIEVLDRKKQ